MQESSELRLKCDLGKLCAFDVSDDGWRSVIMSHLRYSCFMTNRDV